MLFYCLKCKSKTDSKNPRVEKTKKRKSNAFIKLCSLQLKKRDLSKRKKLLSFLSNFGIKTPLSNIPLVCPILLTKFNFINKLKQGIKRMKW